jgi:DNA-binding transcriptional LysR family regulator
MSLINLRYLDALARHRHFGRAAEACNVAQPTLSAGIRALEREFDAPLVQRGQRVQGLTQEGERVLTWARRMLYEWDALRHEVQGVHERLHGRVRLGAVPTALPVVAALTEVVCQRHPDVRVTVLSMTSNKILEGLTNFTLDVGLTYLDNEPVPPLDVLTLYHERYVLLTPKEGVFGRRERVGWAEAADLPLCLLSGDMQNRRLIDAAFAHAGAAPTVKVETNSLITLCAHVRPGGWSSILPRALLDTIATPRDAAAIPLVTPERAPAVGLAAARTDPVPPLIAATWACAQDLVRDPRTGVPGPPSRPAAD